MNWASKRKSKKRLESEIVLLRLEILALKEKMESVARERDRWMSQTF